MAFRRNKKELSQHLKQGQLDKTKLVETKETTNAGEEEDSYNQIDPYTFVYQGEISLTPIENKLEAQATEDSKIENKVPQNSENAEANSNEIDFKGQVRESDTEDKYIEAKRDYFVLRLSGSHFLVREQKILPGTNDFLIESIKIWDVETARPIADVPIHFEDKQFHGVCDYRCLIELPGEKLVVMYNDSDESKGHQKQEYRTVLYDLQSESITVISKERHMKAISINEIQFAILSFNKKKIDFFEIEPTLKLKGSIDTTSKEYILDFEYLPTGEFIAIISDDHTCETLRLECYRFDEKNNLFKQTKAIDYNEKGRSEIYTVSNKILVLNIKRISLEHSYSLAHPHSFARVISTLLIYDMNLKQLITRQFIVSNTVGLYPLADKHTILFREYPYENTIQLLDINSPDSLKVIKYQEAGSNKKYRLERGFVVLDILESGHVLMHLSDTDPTKVYVFRAPHMSLVKEKTKDLIKESLDVVTAKSMPKGIVNIISDQVGGDVNPSVLFSKSKKNKKEQASKEKHTMPKGIKKE